MTVGPINTQARDVLELLTDPARCQVVLVTLPEETPVNELVDTAYALEDRVGVALGPVVVNGLYPERSGLDADPVAAAEEAGVALSRGGRSARATAAAFRRRPVTLQDEQVARLSERLPLPQIHLPFLFTTDLTHRRRATTSPTLRSRASLVLDSLPRHRRSKRVVAASSIVLCCGSGGVGKTTTAAVDRAARRRARAAVLSSSRSTRPSDWPTPSGSRGSPTRPSQIDGDWPGELWAMMLDTKTTFDELVARYSTDPAQAERILGNRFYRNISGALSGTQEYMAMEKLYELHEETRLRPRRRRHAADPQRPRLPRRAAPADPVPRPPPVPHPDDAGAAPT